MPGTASPPIDEAAARYVAFRDRVMAGGGGVLRERAGGKSQATPPSELELQARWFAGELGREFTGTEGERIRLVQFGIWNRAAGPDFMHAAIQVNGEERTGAIEIDLEANGWVAHGHAENPAYDEVVLHVFLQDAGAPRFFTRTHANRNVVQVALSAEDVGALAGRPNVPPPEARLGRCSVPLEGMDPDRLGSLLRSAARHRLEQKARRLNAMADAHGREQTLYQGLAEALGYRRNKLPLGILAQRLTLKEMLSNGRVTREARLFGVAGFLEHEAYETGDPEARTYLRGLWDQWWKDQAQWAVSEERKPHWILAGTRPGNHPQRRLGALAAVLDHWKDLRKAFPEGAAEKSGWATNVRKILSGLDHPFWSTHYTLRAKPAPKPMALIGRDRVTDILGNLYFPLALADSAGDCPAWQAYLKLPGSQVSESLRRAKLRLLGNHPDRLKLGRLFYEQQALLQLYQDFCLEDHSDCAECPFPEQLREWS